MMSRPTIVLITPTWAGDVDHFRVMRRSLEASPLAGLDHYVVVQTEDLPLFEEFRDRPGLELLSTAQVLPVEVEDRRVRARRLADRYGRSATRMAGSLKRVLGWPKWPSYTGWHTQQLCKLKLASETTCDLAVVLDSDLVVTGSASTEDFVSQEGAVCFADWQPRQKLGGKVRNWVEESEKLVRAKTVTDPVNVYFDTPFVFDRKLLERALWQLQQDFGKPWWQVLLDRPPRRWSEFGFYKAYLNHRAPADSITWREPDFSRYIYDTSDPGQVLARAKAMMQDPDIHYITIHSQASGREDWDADAYLKGILELMEQGR